MFNKNLFPLKTLNKMLKSQYKLTKNIFTYTPIIMLFIVLGVNSLQLINDNITFLLMMILLIIEIVLNEIVFKKTLKKFELLIIIFYFSVLYFFYLQTL